MKKLLVLITAFAFANQASAALAPVAVVAPVNNKVTISSAAAHALAKVKAFSSDVLAKAETFVVANPKTAVAYAVVATLVAEHVASFVYNNLVDSNDADQADEDLDIV